VRRSVASTCHFQWPSRALRQTAWLLPGLAVAAVVALVAHGVSEIWPQAPGQVAIAVLLGVAVAAVTRMPDALLPGVQFAVRWLLRLAIVLLGARFILSDVASLGASSLVAIVACLLMTLTGGYLLLAKFGARGALGALIVLGTAICGNSAIVAAAPVLRASEREVTYAVATITLFGVLAVALYPLVGGVLDLAEPSYGIWAGTAINDTSQVVAASYGYGATAGDTATVVKLTRNLFMAPVLFVLALRVGMGSETSLAAQARSAIPLFVLGFVGMAGARSIGLLDVSIGSRPLFELADSSAHILMLIALAAVGLQTKVHKLRELGFRPLLLGLVLSLLLATWSLALVHFAGFGG